MNTAFVALLKLFWEENTLCIVKKICQKSNCMIQGFNSVGKSKSFSAWGCAMVYISLNMKVPVFEGFSLTVTARLTDWNVPFASPFLQAENVLRDVLVLEKDGGSEKVRFIC